MRLEVCTGVNKGIAAHSHSRPQFCKKLGGRPVDRTVEVTFTLDPHRFSEVERVLRIIFGAKL